MFTIGIALAANLVVGFAIGWGVDLLTGTFPVFAFVGFGLGLITAGVTVYRLSRRYM
ncbi:MAG: AtpZ/AtpI family protein [Pseudonocardia sp.]|nr:AtpZ/AtpI family protein [Pseudonocardia sp.]